MIEFHLKLAKPCPAIASPKGHAGLGPSLGLPTLCDHQPSSFFHQGNRAQIHTHSLTLHDQCIRRIANSYLQSDPVQA